MNIEFKTWYGEEPRKWSYDSVAALEKTTIDKTFPVWDVRIDGKELQIHMWLDDLIKYCKGR